MTRKHIPRGGFALPTVLIASVVMIGILAVSVSSVTAVRTTLKAQYYEQLAKSAGEAGVAYAKACLAKNGNVPLWSDTKPLTPATDCAGNTLLGPAVQALVVAGGGGGGDNHGGGGGGGGVVQVDSIGVTNGTYSIVVGSGGAGGSGSAGTAGSNGGNSTAFTYTATGGGGGGGRVATNSVTQARSGGSGGGGAGTIDGGTGVPASGATGIPTQGNDGGGGSSGATAGNGGGGGGAGAVGGVANGTAANAGVSGAGGNGLLSYISGEQVYYGAGGSGGRWASGSVGTGGITGGGTGGNNDSVAGSTGQANTGAGGGGGGGGTADGGAGGSGVVVVRYANNGSVTATGGTVYTSGPYRIHKFTSSGNFVVSATNPSSCPSDPRCSVTVNDGLRSSFTIGKPAVDANGKAISIPNNGYVELLRSSNGQVWRTYRQPAVQVAVVPDLCSGAASSPLGWSNAVRATTQGSLPNATTAETISLSAGNVNAGRMYYRKDFTATQSGTYTVSAQSLSAADVVELYVNGTLAVTAQNGIATGSVTLPVGCHTVSARVTNKTLLPRQSQFTAAIQQSGSEPIVATNTSWRVSAGASEHYSESDFYADPSVWGDVIDLGSAVGVSGSWASLTSDAFSQTIGSSCGAVDCPFASSTYFRNERDFITTAAETEIQVSSICDDNCRVYLDGKLVIQSGAWANINQQSLVIGPGSHRIGVQLYNGGTVVNPSRFAVSVYDKDNSVVLARSDIHWQTAMNQWVSGWNDGNDPISYEASFRPSPNEVVEPVTADILLVGGGAGAASNAAGGGGGGGVRYFEAVPMTTGSKSITIGNGGGGGVSSTGTPGDGGASQYMNTTYRVLGGGHGAPRSTSLILAGSGNGTFATGGGGAGAYTTANQNGGLGTPSQGGNGGSGTPMDAGCNARGGGGGGAGGSGGTGVSGGASGAGGAGYITYLTGTRLAFGGGGGGSGPTCGTSYGLTTDGAGPSSDAGAATANTGGGGTASNGSATGGNGAAGTVIVRFKTGSMTVSATGSPSVSTATINGIGYTIYRYNANGTFNPTALTP